MQLEWTWRIVGPHVNGDFVGAADCGEHVVGMLVGEHVEVGERVGEIEVGPATIVYLELIATRF